MHPAMPVRRRFRHLHIGQRRQPWNRFPIRPRPHPPKPNLRQIPVHPQQHRARVRPGDSPHATKHVDAISVIEICVLKRRHRAVFKCRRKPDFSSRTWGHRRYFRIPRRKNLVRRHDDHGPIRRQPQVPRQFLCGVADRWVCGLRQNLEPRAGYRRDERNTWQANKCSHAMNSALFASNCNSHTRKCA